MAPFYRGFQSKVSLERDDVVAVQALYGARGEEEEEEEEERTGSSFCTALSWLSCSSSSPGWDWEAQHCTASGRLTPATVTLTQSGLVITVWEMQEGANTALTDSRVRLMFLPWWWMKFHWA